jgi:hypothetical protein
MFPLPPVARELGGPDVPNTLDLSHIAMADTGPIHYKWNCSSKARGRAPDLHDGSQLVRRPTCRLDRSTTSPTDRETERDLFVYQSKSFLPVILLVLLQQ